MSYLFPDTPRYNGIIDHGGDSLQRLMVNRAKEANAMKFAWMNKAGHLVSVMYPNIEDANENSVNEAVLVRSRDGINWVPVPEGTDHLGVNIEDHMARIESEIREAYGTMSRVLMVLHKGDDSRDDYWESQYIVMVQGTKRNHYNNNLEYHTVKVCIDSAGKGMCVDGWYGRSYKQAQADAICRVNLHTVAA